MVIPFDVKSVHISPDNSSKLHCLPPFDSFYEKHRLMLGEILTPRVQSVRIYRVILWVIRFHLDIRYCFDPQVILTLGHVDGRYLSRPR